MALASGSRNWLESSLGRRVSRKWARVIVSITKTCALRKVANKRGNSSRLTQSFHFSCLSCFFFSVNALNESLFRIVSSSPVTSPAKPGFAHSSPFRAQHWCRPNFYIPSLKVIMLVFFFWCRMYALTISLIQTDCRNKVTSGPETST